MDKKVLVVDELDNDRKQLVDILQTKYPVATADSLDGAKRAVMSAPMGFSVIFIDVTMVGRLKESFFAFLRGRNLLDRIPVIVCAPEGSDDEVSRALENGASDYIRKPYEAAKALRRAKILSDLFDYRTNLEIKLVRQARELKEQYKAVAAQAKAQAESMEKITDILGGVVEYRNYENGDHVIRVKEFTRILTEAVMINYPEYKIDGDMLENIVAASALHDLGKIAIPDSVLMKPGRLTEEEYELIKSHSLKGAEIIEDIEGVWPDDFKQICYDICKFHHERYDGTGYPYGLSGDDIPIAAQIVSITDTYDALVSERIYKRAYPTDKSFNMIISGECGGFNAKLLECFRKARPMFEATHAELKPREGNAG